MLPHDKISPSKISTFDTCKFKYWLTYFRPDIKLKSNFGACNGTIIHAILDARSRDESVDIEAMLRKGLSGQLEATERDGSKKVAPSPLPLAKAKDYADIKKECEGCKFNDNGVCTINSLSIKDSPGCPKPIYEDDMKILTKVVEKYSVRRWKDILRDKDGQYIGIEYPMRIKFDNPYAEFTGFFDLVTIENNSTVHIFDYKAGNKTKSLAECEEDWQARLYAVVGYLEFVEDVNKKGYSYKKVIVHFDYFRGKEITIECDEDKRSTILSEAREKISEMRSLKRIDRIARDDYFPWQCKALCDIDICKSEWNGSFAFEV